MNAIDYWVRAAVHGESFTDEIFACLRQEVPPMASWVSRGGCSVQCSHCLFPFEGSKPIGEHLDASILINVLRQLGPGASLIHEGRQLQPRQVPLLREVSEAGYFTTLITNGQYATSRTLEALASKPFLHSLDVSVDGTEEEHNLQRGDRNGPNKQAWNIAMRGFAHAREILRPGGKLTSLFTLTSVNHDVVCETGDMLMPIVDEWHVTTMSLRPGIEHMRASDEVLPVALEQLLSARWPKPVFLKFYSLQDFVVFLRFLGAETARKVLFGAQVQYNAVVFNIGDVQIFFFPKSLWSNEIVVVDADGWWRFPYAVSYTLEELRSGKDTHGNDIAHLSVCPLASETDVREHFPGAVERWWNAVGEDAFIIEKGALQPFMR